MEVKESKENSSNKSKCPKNDSLITQSKSDPVKSSKKWVEAVPRNMNSFQIYCHKFLSCTNPNCNECDTFNQNISDNAIFKDSDSDPECKLLKMTQNYSKCDSDSEEEKRSAHEINNVEKPIKQELNETPEKQEKKEMLDETAFLQFHPKEDNKQYCKEEESIKNRELEKINENDEETIKKSLYHKAKKDFYERDSNFEVIVVNQIKKADKTPYFFKYGFKEGFKEGKDKSSNPMLSDMSRRVSFNTDMTSIKSVRKLKREASPCSDDVLSEDESVISTVTELTEKQKKIIRKNDKLNNISNNNTNLNLNVKKVKKEKIKERTTRKASAVLDSLDKTTKEKDKEKEKKTKPKKNSNPNPSINNQNLKFFIPIQNTPINPVYTPQYQVNYIYPTYNNTFPTYNPTFPNYPKSENLYDKFSYFPNTSPMQLNQLNQMQLNHTMTTTIPSINPYMTNVNVPYTIPNIQIPTINPSYINPMQGHVIPPQYFSKMQSSSNNNFLLNNQTPLYGAPQVNNSLLNSSNVPHVTK